PAGPILSAISRAWPPPPNVQSTAISPGCGSITSINSPARTGMCVWVMSSSVAKTRCDIGDTGKDVLSILVVGLAVPDLDALARAGDDHFLVERRVAHEGWRDHQAVGGIELCIKRGVEEEALQFARPRRGRVQAIQRLCGERLVAI